MIKPSLILLNYNNYRFLPACLASVQAQQESYKDIFFLDDNSTDATLIEMSEMVVGYLPDAVIVQNATNEGVKQSLLKHLQRNAFEWVQILATDDVLLEVSGITISSKNSKFDLMLADGVYLDASSNYIGGYKNYRSPQKFSMVRRDNFILYHNPVIAPGLIFHKQNAVESLEHTDVNFEDWPIVRNTLLKGGKFINLTSVKIGYRMHNNSLSSANAKHRNLLNRQIKIFLKESSMKTNSCLSKLFIYLQLRSISKESRLLKYLKVLDLNFLFWKLKKILLY